MKPTYREKEKSIHNLGELMKLQKSLEKSEKDYMKLMEAVSTINQKLNLIIKNVSEVIYVLDPNGNITYISDEVKRYGINAKELFGISIMDIVHPDDKNKAEFKINERRKGLRRTTECEIRLFSQDQVKKHIKGEIDGIDEVPLFVVSAEGYYKNVAGKAQSFMGTIGVAKEVIAFDRFNTEEAEEIKDESILPVIGTKLKDNFIPICANCKKIRDEKGEWESVEDFINKHLRAQMTHSICPECVKKLYPDISD